MFIYLIVVILTAAISVSAFKYYSKTRTEPPKNGLAVAIILGIFSFPILLAFFSPTFIEYQNLFHPPGLRKVYIGSNSEINEIRYLAREISQRKFTSVDELLTGEGEILYSKTVQDSLGREISYDIRIDPIVHVSNSSYDKVRSEFKTEEDFSDFCFKWREEITKKLGSEPVVDFILNNHKDTSEREMIGKIVVELKKWFDTKYSDLGLALYVSTDLNGINQMSITVRKKLKLNLE